MSKPWGASQWAAPLHGLCISSWLQVPALLQFLSWLPSVMDYNLGVQAEQTLASPTCFMISVCVTAIETIAKIIIWTYFSVHNTYSICFIFSFSQVRFVVGFMFCFNFFSISNLFFKSLEVSFVLLYFLFLCTLVFCLYLCERDRSIGAWVIDSCELRC